MFRDLFKVSDSVKVNANYYSLFVSKTFLCVQVITKPNSGSIIMQDNAPSIKLTIDHVKKNNNFKDTESVEWISVSPDINLIPNF